MRKVIFFAIVSLFAVLSCQKDGMGDEAAATVYFNVEVPGDLHTKSIGDGTTVDELHYAVYNTDKNKYISSLDGVVPTPVVTADGKRGWSLGLRLVKNYTYHIFFWAQKEGAPYVFDKAGATVKVNYAGNANDESRDAFCYLATVTVPSDVKDFKANDGKPFELRRPFAQINFGASDYSMIHELGLSMTSTVKVKGLADTYHFLKGTVSGDAETTLDLAPIPHPEALVVKGDALTYGYVGMNYILAPENEYDQDGNVVVKHVVNDMEATFAYNSSQVELEIPNVPYQRNFRTNIIGNLFSGDVTVDVIIVEGFFGEYEHVYPQKNQ